jgi:hypothetical protein
MSIAFSPKQSIVTNGEYHYVSLEEVRENKKIPEFREIDM